MLTKKHQQFLLLLLKKDVKKKDNKLYDSSAFYRMISYMKRNGLIKINSIQEEDNAGYVRSIHQYSLTWKGSLLARILCSLSDVDPALKKEFASLFG